MKNLDTSTVDKIFIATLVGGERNANRLNFVVFGFFFRTLETRTGAPTFRQTAGSAQKVVRASVCGRKINQRSAAESGSNTWEKNWRGKFRK